MSELTIRPYRHEDEEEVLEVLRLALGVTPILPQTPRAWRWKHFENPFGESRILLGYRHGELAGVRCYLQWRFLTPDGRTLKALRAVDTATNPAHQRQGVFRKLTFESKRLAHRAGFDLIYNTPNRSSLPGYLSMGWQMVGTPRLYFRPLSFKGVLPRRGASESIPDPQQVLAGGRSINVSEDWKDRPPMGLRTPRSREYLHWRYTRHPTVPYRETNASGWFIIARPNRRTGRTETVLSELLQGEDSQSKGGVPFKSGDADYLVASARPDGPEAARLRRWGFLPVPLKGLNLVANPLSSDGRQALGLDAWDLSLGDLELL